MTSHRLTIEADLFQHLPASLGDVDFSNGLPPLPYKAI